MRDGIADSSSSDRHSFRAIVDGFLTADGLPFADVISAAKIEAAFARRGTLFGEHGIYSTAITLWAFLSQVLRDGKEASCQSAVARVVTYCSLTGLEPPGSDTGIYCRARRKLSEEALRELTRRTAQDLEEAAEPDWLWKGMHAKLIDGFTFTMPDTPENQAIYPQANTQAPGVGLPIARAVAVLSLATAAVVDLAVGPYKGKQTGETALLRTLLHNFSEGDVAVADRYYCSFMMIALLLGRGTQVCARMHQLRHTDFRRGRRLGKYDHIIKWTRPQRPKWMSPEQYDQIPETLELREIRYRIIEKGRRTKSITIATTLTDPQQYSKEDIAELYGFRWNSELDIRSIKSSLNLGHVRCKSPQMVHRELWVTLLAYNLIRTTAANAAALHGKQPRQISFVSTCQYILSSWMIACSHPKHPGIPPDAVKLLLRQISECEVANRPGRLEPRVLKRRRHGYPLMQKPRPVLQAQLRKRCT